MEDVILPLFIVLASFTAFAGEREQGPLRQPRRLGVRRRTSCRARYSEPRRARAGDCPCTGPWRGGLGVTSGRRNV